LFLGTFLKVNWFKIERKMAKIDDSRARRAKFSRIFRSFFQVFC
jgi:hypothetical protein